MERLTCSWIVHGKVQRVSFRAYVRRQALRLNIQGFAKNLPDGTVHVVAHGTASALKTLREKIGRGPRKARVDQVVDQPEPIDPITGNEFLIL